MKQFPLDIWNFDQMFQTPDFLFQTIVIVDPLQNSYFTWKLLLFVYKR